MSCAEMQLRTRVKNKLGWTVTIGRAANITRPINGRGPCHYCGPCEHGCLTHSYFNAAFTTVADALESGNTTLITNAMVYRVLTDPSTRKATGVMYIDRVTREVKEVRARAVLLCAQALESARILLNSADGGLANSSGVLGHYLMDHTWVAGGASGEFPDAPAPKPSLGAPRRPNGLYTIRMKNTINGPREKKYLRGFGFQGGGSTSFRMNAPGYGDAFKKAILDPLTSITLVGFGEVLPRYENFVGIDPKVVDKFGIPVPRITMTWGENEKAMIPDMAVAATQMMEAAGAKNIQPFTVLDRVPGYGIHEMGTARMGNDPKTSVLNPFLQTHDISNLYVMDASSFVSGGCQNPTLTIMALAVRGCDHLMQEMKRGNV
jgi:choline dehydrogenase-like flavoprotein